MLIKLVPVHDPWDMILSYIHGGLQAHTKLHFIDKIKVLVYIYTNY